MKRRSLNLVNHNFESYERLGYKVAITMRISGTRQRQRVVLHSVDLKRMLEAMREAETSNVAAAQTILDTAAGEK